MLRRSHAVEGGCLVISTIYSVPELEHMLESICEHLPITIGERDLVVDCHPKFNPK